MYVNDTVDLEEPLLFRVTPIASWIAGRDKVDGEEPNKYLLRKDNRLVDADRQRLVIISHCHVNPHFFQDSHYAFV